MEQKFKVIVEVTSDDAVSADTIHELFCRTIHEQDSGALDKLTALVSDIAVEDLP